MTETFELPFPPNVKLSLTLFVNIKNGKEIKDLVMSGKIDASLVKPRMILDQFQLLVAATKAFHAKQAGKMTTRTLHSELLYSLSPNKNISDCFKKFGFDKSDKALLVAEIHEDGQSKSSEVCAHICGDVVPLSKLTELSDESEIHKIYKIIDAELTVGTLSEAVVGRIASKDFASF